MNNTRPIDRPLGAFFLIAFLWTWSAALLMIVAPDWVERTIGPVSPGNPLFFLAVYGPSIAAKWGAEGTPVNHSPRWPAIMASAGTPTSTAR